MKTIINERKNNAIAVYQLFDRSYAFYKTICVNADSLPPKYIDDWNVTNGNTIILIMSSLF